MKNKHLIIVISCIAVAAICIALTFWGNWKNNGVLTTDAFIGVMATFIGICATLIVGVQIVSFFELKEMKAHINTIQEERKLLEEEQEAFSVEMYNTRLSVGNALTLIAFTAQKNNDLATEFNSWLLSIIIDDWSSMKGSALLLRYQRLVEIAKLLFPSDDNSFLEDTYRKLTILVIPEDIEYHDKIMSLHYKLLSDIKSNIETNSKDNQSTK